MKQEFEKYYKMMLEEGKKYKELLPITLNEATAFEISKVLDNVNYSCKCCLEIYRKKRQLTDLEKSWLEYTTQESYTLTYLKKYRKYLPINDMLKKLIIRVKEIYEKEIKENEEDEKIFIQFSLDSNTATTV